jgi:hypothetical protein
MLTPQAIGQIADEAIEALLPSSGAAPSRFWKRGVFFDHRRTLASFRQDSTMPASRLALHHGVKEGSATMLADCDSFLQKTCSGLGWGLYMYMEPIAISETSAKVRVSSYFADRFTEYADGVPPVGKGKLAGSITVVYLTRERGGPWKFLRADPSMVF